MRLRTREPYTLTAEAGVKATLKSDRRPPRAGYVPPSMAVSARSTMYGTRGHPRSAALRSPAIFCAGPSSKLRVVEGPRPGSRRRDRQPVDSKWTRHGVPPATAGCQRVEIVRTIVEVALFRNQQVNAVRVRAPAARFSRSRPLGALFRQAADRAGGAFRRLVCARRHLVRRSLHARSSVAVWRRRIVSAIAYAAHTAYERFRLRHSPSASALHVGLWRRTRSIWTGRRRRISTHCLSDPPTSNTNSCCSRSRSGRLSRRYRHSLWPSPPTSFSGVHWGRRASRKGIERACPAVEPSCRFLQVVPWPRIRRSRKGAHVGWRCMPMSGRCSRTTTSISPTRN